MLDYSWKSLSILNSWLWTPKLKGLYSLSFVDLLWFCGQIPAQHGRLDILTQNVIRSCHSKKNLPCTRQLVIKRVNSEKSLVEVDIKPICAICLMLNVTKEYYDIVLLWLWDSKCLHFRIKEKAVAKMWHLNSHSHYLVTDNDPSVQKCTKLRL